MIRIQKLNDEKDGRGEKYFLPDSMLQFIGDIKEMHYVSVDPDAIRGNHVHKSGKESVILSCSDSWQMSWKNPDEQMVQHQLYEERGAYLIEIEPGTIHAFKNTGKDPVYLYCFSNLKYDPAHPDTERQVIVD